jgi:hypothetical protein
MSITSERPLVNQHDNSDPRTDVIDTNAIRRAVNNDREVARGKSNRRRNMVFGGIATTTAALAIAGAAIFNAGEKAGSNDHEVPLSPDVNTSAPEIPGAIDTQHTSTEILVGHGEEYLASVREANTNKLRELGFEISPEYAEDASDKGLADGVFVDLYSAWKLGTTDKISAENVLGSIIDPDDTDDFVRTRDRLGDGGQPLLSNVFEVGDYTQNFYNSNFEDVKSNGRAMRVLSVRLRDNPHETDAGIINQITYQRVAGVMPDGTSFEKWRIAKMVPSDDDDYKGDLTQTRAQVS